MPKQKIAILINTLAGGGAERTVTHLLWNLRDDYEVHLVLFSDVIEYDLPKDQIINLLDKESPTKNSGANILKIPKLSGRLVKYCNENNIDLVLSFLHRPNFVACHAKKRGLAAKVLISERIYTPLWYRAAELRGKIGNFLISRLYPYADAILPNSEGTRNALRDNYGIRGEYVVVKNLISIDDVNKLRTEDVDDFDFGAFTFVCVAGFREQKNHRALINAFADIEDKSVRLLLIGKGALLDKAREQVTSLDLQDRVTFLGHRDNPFKYISRAGCFVLASDFEGFPNVLIEALACGTPIISTDCLTGPRELLAPEPGVLTPAGEFGRYGVLVPVGDTGALTAAMTEMAGNESLRERYKTDSPGRAAEYDQKIVIEEFRSVINEHLVID